MKTRLLILGLAAITFGVTSAVVCADPTAPWQAAAGLMKAHDYSGALAKLDQQLQSTPQDLLTLRLKGMCLIELNRAPEALPVLEQALKVDPKSTACRFYLARAHVESGNLHLGIELLQRVMTDEPESAYAERAKELLPSLQNLATAAAAVAAVEPTRRWHFQTTLAGEYDDNVSNGSHAHHPIDSFRLKSTATVDLHLLDQTIDKTPVTVGLAYDFYRTLHERNEAAEDFDYENHAGSLYLSRKGEVLGLPADVKLSGGFAQDWLGGRQYSSHEDVTLVGGVQYTDWTYFGLTTSGQWIDYQHQVWPHTLNARDGNNQSLGFEHFFYLFENRWILGVDYKHTWYDTQGRLFELEGDTVGLSSQLLLPWELTWTVGLRYTHDGYDIYQPPPDRIDNAYTFSTGLSRSLWIPGLYADLHYLRIMSDSNKDFSTYTRNVISLGVRYTY